MWITKVDQFLILAYTCDMKQTQKQFVIKQLRETGEITRNMCLKNYITRLASIIPTLRKEGWGFNTYYREENGSKDYVYQVVSKPSEAYTITMPTKWNTTQTKLFNSYGPE